MTIQDDRLLTVREVARQCGRTEETVRRWIWSGKLTARKLGNQLFVSAEEAGRVGGQAVRSLPTNRPYTKKELLRQAEEDERFSDEMLAKYGLIDAPDLVRQVREESVSGQESPIRYSKRDIEELERREKKLRDKLFRKYGYFDVAELVRQSREGH